jgi:hypothetical protein
MKTVEENGLPTHPAAEEKLRQPGMDAASPQEKGEQPDPASQDKAKSRPDNKRLLVLGGGTAILVVLLAFAIMGVFHNTANLQKQVTKNAKKTPEKTANNAATSSVPMLDAGRPAPQETDAGRATAERIGQTAQRQNKTTTPPNLGGVKPFDSSQNWQPAPYRSGLQPPDPAGETSGPTREATETRSERDAMDKPSLLFVKSNASSAPRAGASGTSLPIDLGIGLPPGTRLRARLESAISTAVRTPVVALIEYSYEQDGEVAIPAGARVFGHLEAADRSGYIGIRFDSLLMPDGSAVSLEAAATDLQLRPLKGKVEGKGTGKNILVRSFAGVGEIAATLVGRGSVNQPLSEGDLLREWVSNNIGQASDQSVANLAISQRIVVSVPAGTEIYVVFEKAAKENASTTDTKAADRPGTTFPGGSPSTQELRQLLQLQRELNQGVSTQNQ